MSLKGSIQQVSAHRIFNKAVDYYDLLEAEREEFEKRWAENSKSWETGLDGFDLMALIGQGAFGQRLVREQKSSIYYAVKEMLKESVVKSKQVQHVMNEKRVLYSIKFPFLIGLEFSSKDNDCVYLGMPFINGGELFTYLRKVRKFNEKQARFYASQVLLGLEFLHHCQLLYRDLKPENIMLDHLGYIKLTDFGFAKRVDSRTMTLCGTPEYLAPEIILSKPYGTSVDWWAFGVLIYEFVAGTSPFAQYNRDIVMMFGKICEGDFQIPKTFTDPLENLCKGLMEVDRSKRFGGVRGGPKDVKQHPWFKTINWFALLNKELNAPYRPYMTDMEDLSNFEQIRGKASFLKSPTPKYEELFADF